MQNSAFTDSDIVLLQQECSVYKCIKINDGKNVTTNEGNIPNTQCTLQDKGTMADNKLTNKGEHFLNPQERADKGKTLKQLITASLQNETRKRYQTLSFTSIEFCASFILATVV